MGLDTKTYWLTDRQSQCDFDFDFRDSLEMAEEWEIGVRWSPCAEERPLLEAATKQRSEHRVWEH
jgi:hypothetical protein